MSNRPEETAAERQRNGVINALTVDVEDYFHVSAFADAINRESWPELESRVQRNTGRTLEILAANDVSATFFVLGWVAERFPALVREIASAGHEVACHGYSHQLVYKQSKSEFEEETRRALGILEDQVQAPIRGYRAASYSITSDSLWALDVLVDCGFQYDSSIFPIRHDLYGIAGSNPWPHRMSTPSGRKIIEFPLSTARMAGLRIPVAGGGYFRLFPFWFTRLGLNRINRQGHPFIFYLHPWELDPDQPRINAKASSRLRHYNNLDRCEARFRSLLEQFEFSTVADVLMSQGLELSPRTSINAT